MKRFFDEIVVWSLQIGVSLIKHRTGSFHLAFVLPNAPRDGQVWRMFYETLGSSLICPIRALRRGEVDIALDSGETGAYFSAPVADRSIDQRPERVLSSPEPIHQRRKDSDGRQEEL